MDLTHVTVTVEHHFTAAPARVFALLSDVEQMAGLGPEHHTATWTDDSRRRFEGQNKIGEMGWSVRCVVIADEPPGRFGWTVGEPGEHSSTWTYDLVPAGEGTLVTQTFTHGPGVTYLSLSCDKRPEKAQSYIDGRTDMLRANMLHVLASADVLLQR
jgi:uncharacterized protein YndB with AHSA1/START domain